MVERGQERELGGGGGGGRELISSKSVCVTCNSKMN